jgi:hypothetical protein
MDQRCATNAVTISMFGADFRNSLALKLAAAASALLCGPLSPSLAQAQTFTVDTSATSPLTGLWWNANESGWGATITQQSDRLFVAMYVYDAAGNPVWYSVSCGIAGAGCTGDMLRVKGGSTPTATWNGSGLNVTKAGTMTLQFTSNDAASMSYTLDGQGATKQITRTIFGPPPPVIPGLAGTWFGSIIETRSNCTQAQNNGGRATYGQYDIGLGAGSSGTINVSLAGVTGLQCTYSGNFTTNGARLFAGGTLSCNDGKRGTWQSSRIDITAKSMTLELAVLLNTTETCTVATILGGLRP